MIHHRVYVNPKGMFWWCRETSEEALQFLWLAKTLYPQRFADVDMRKETRRFYQDFLALHSATRRLAMCSIRRNDSTGKERYVAIR